MEKSLRRQYLVKPGFQRKMMLIIILVVAIAANLVGGLCFMLISATLESELLTKIADPSAASQLTLLKKDLFVYMFPKILMAEGIAIFLVGLLTLRISHHIAGPVYRLEKNMMEMASGNLFLKTSFRSGDEFLELANALNHLGASFGEKLMKIREILLQMDQSHLNAQQKEKLLAIEKEIAFLEIGKQNGFKDENEH